MSKPKTDFSSGYLVEHTCPICKKNFIPAPYHVYHVGGAKNHVHKPKLVCSYLCELKSIKN
jgi:hypothetical protein